MANLRSVFARTSRLFGTFRQAPHKVTAGDVVFRRAHADDKAEVLSMRKNVHRGLDYLPDYFDFFMQDKNRKCFVGESGDKLVAFGVMLTLDGGETLVGQAGRVHERYEGRGIFGSLTRLLNATARENGCRARAALVETTLNKYTRTERFKKTHVEITSRLHYAGVVTHQVRESLQHIVDQCQYMGLSDVIHDVTNDDLTLYINDKHYKRYLFPAGRLLVDYIPYHCMNENIPLLRGRNTNYFSTVGASGKDVKGLLSSETHYRCSHPPATYTIDIFGSNPTDLETHVLFHLARAFETIEGEFCLQIFVEKGYIAQKLCRLLIQLDIPKCNWYVEGGIACKTIVEEILR